jgi:hypothetical protein
VVVGSFEDQGRQNSEIVAPTRRLVALGASNLSRGLPTLIATARRAWSEPLDIVAAAGRGRSYGQTTRMFGREIAGIAQSLLWDELDRRAELPTSALLTDVGNDIMYGVPVDVLFEWLGRTLERLRAMGAATVVTALPVGPIHTLKPHTFLVLRTLLFPANRDSLDHMLDRVRQVDAGLRRLAAEYGATLFDPPPFWYGFDVIHIRRARWQTAWKDLVDAWRPPTPASHAAIRPWTWLGGQLQRPAERRLFGIRQVRRQPSAVFADGTRVSLF